MFAYSQYFLVYMADYFYKSICSAEFLEIHKIITIRFTLLFHAFIPND